MKLKFLLPGIALMLVGALPLLAPGLAIQVGTATGIVASPTQSSTYFAYVSPGNYSFLEYHLDAGHEMTARVASGQQTVDFFLMNGGNFTAWRQSGGEPSQVYPQSSLGVKNYTFTVSASATSRDYFMVFISRSTTSSTDVLIRLSLQNTNPDPTMTTAPIVLSGVGLVVTVYGVRSTKKSMRPDPQEKVRPTTSAGGWQGLLGIQAPRCKYCGAALAEGSSFCPTCSKSQT